MPVNPDLRAGTRLNPDLCTMQADFTPQDAAEDTITGRFRGPSQESAQEVYDLIADARANPEKYGRPASWPRNVHADEHDYGAALGAQTIDGHGPPSETARRVSGYFDAVNFCRRARCPAVVALGMVDTCVPPTTVFSALNCLEQSSLTVITATDRGHNADGDPRYRRDDFLCEMAERGGSRLLRAGVN